MEHSCATLCMICAVVMLLTTTATTSLPVKRESYDVTHDELGDHHQQQELVFLDSDDGLYEYEAGRSRLSGERNTDDSSDGYIALPLTFQRYDLNMDGFVTTLELSDATGTRLEENTRPFHVADLNDDGLLTESELLQAPWVFDNRTTHRYRHDFVV